MKVLHVRNVCDALPDGLRHLESEGIEEDSRAGTVIVAPTPVTTVYDCPTEKVLTCPFRDANPFFHLIEAMWMLAGRNDARYLDTYVRDFSSRFAEKNGLQWGAYGFRWRNHFEDDQLEAVIARLTLLPGDRRTVLSMWDPQHDLWHTQDEGPEPRDLPCNTNIYFRPQATGELDMTVCCRSNDIIWGAYGANAVHFGFLLEFVAGMAGLRVGRYYQVSNNYHAYQRILDKLRTVQASHTYHELKGQPLVTHPATFMNEVRAVLNGSQPSGWRNPFLEHTVFPAMEAHRAYREGRTMAAIQVARQIASEDWQVACADWLARRVK